MTAALAPRQPARVAATAMVIVAACCFGAISTLVIIALRAGASLATILALRYVIAGVVMAALARGEMFADWRRTLLVFSIGGMGQSLIAGVSLASLRWIDAATLGFLFYTYPAWVTLFAALSRTESLDRLKLGALALSLAGIAFIVARPGGMALHPIGMTLALLAAIIYAAYLPLIGRLQGPMSAVAATGWIGIGAAVVFGATAAARHELFEPVAPVGWLAIAVLALACTAFAFVLFLRGLALLGPVRTAIVSTVEPFFTAVLAFALLEQPLALHTLAGGALIAAAVILLHARRAPG